MNDADVEIEGEDADDNNDVFDFDDVDGKPSPHSWHTGIYLFLNGSFLVFMSSKLVKHNTPVHPSTSTGNQLSPRHNLTCH